jgi:predicted nucleotidyltransferase
MTNDMIKEKVLVLIGQYPIKRIALFGSRAAGTYRADSDVDLILEFTAQVSILTLSQIRCELEAAIGLPVDIIHGPMLSGGTLREA